MKKWLLFSIFHLPGILLMGYSIAHWGKIDAASEYAAIGLCIACFAISLTIWKRYKLEIKPPRFIKD